MSALTDGPPQDGVWVRGRAWLGMAVSRRGSAHPAGQPNQDAAAVRALPGGDLVAAIADGHGGRRHPRSAVGAELAVRLAVTAVTRRPTAPLPELIPSVIADWRAAVREHSRQHPLEQTGGEAPEVAYGSTLLVSVTGAGAVRLAQLGDGDAITADVMGSRRPVPIDERLAADETTSLCLPTADTDVRYVDVGAEPPRLVVLATDGMGKSFTQSDWWSVLAHDYALLLEHRGPAYLADHLPEWLEDSAAVAGDDTTVTLLYRPDLFPTSPRPSVAPIDGAC